MPQLAINAYPPGVNGKNIMFLSVLYILYDFLRLDLYQGASSMHVL